MVALYYTRSIMRVRDGLEVAPMSPAEEWVLLFYRLPRVPSTPRSAVWRKLKRLGVAQLGDGLVALPADARTREQLEWIAEEVTDHGGEAALGPAPPPAPAARSALAGGMTAAVAAEYDAVTAEATAAQEGDLVTRRRVLVRLRRDLRRIAGRDFFPAPQRDAARAAVDDLAAASPPTEVRA